VLSFEAILLLGKVVSYVNKSIMWHALIKWD